MKKTVIHTRTPVNIKFQSLTCDFSAISAWIYNFISEKPRRSAVERPFKCNILHSCRLHSVRGINEKPALLEINYPW